jgi:phosphate transport system protein
MTVHLQRSIEELKDRILTLSGVVEENVRQAVRSIENRDRDLAAAAIDADAKIDQLEMAVEEECLRILALYQPVAGDLRYIVAVLKINNDLERVGDLAVNIAKRAVFLSEQPDVGIPFAFGDICQKTLAMVRDSLDALMNRDVERARHVLLADDEVDDINRKMYQRIAAAVKDSPGKTEILLSYLSASRHLERIADYATNIAEDVIYLTQGEIVRHGGALGR